MGIWCTDPTVVGDSKICVALHNGYGFRWRDLESQRKSGASARNLGGLRVTCPLYADNVARLASGRSLVEGGKHVSSKILPRDLL